MADLFQLGADLREIAMDVASVDVKLKLSEVALTLNQVAEENRRLMDENAELRRQLARRKDLERVGAAYYLIEDDGGQTGPICPRCYQEGGLVCLLREARDGEARCTVCGRTYAGVKASVKGRGNAQVR